MNEQIVRGAQFKCYSGELNLLLLYENCAMFILRFRLFTFNQDCLYNSHPFQCIYCFKSGLGCKYLIELVYINTVANSL